MRLPIVSNYTIASDLISSIDKIWPIDKVNATLGGSSMHHHHCSDEDVQNTYDERQLSEESSMGGKIDVYV